MSSLLQFSGAVSRKGVQLEAYKVERIYTPYQFTMDWERPKVTIRRFSYDDVPTEKEQCPQCGKEHEKLYGFWRKPVGMMGQWVVFRINGEEHVPDLSIPIQLHKMPKDAKPLPITLWHRQ